MKWVSLPAGVERVGGRVASYLQYNLNTSSLYTETPPAAPFLYHRVSTPPAPPRAAAHGVRTNHPLAPRCAPRGQRFMA